MSTKKIYHHIYNLIDVLKYRNIIYISMFYYLSSNIFRYLLHKWTYFTFSSSLLVASAFYSFINSIPLSRQELSDIQSDSEFYNKYEPSNMLLGCVTFSRVLLLFLFFQLSQVLLELILPQKKSWLQRLKVLKTFPNLSRSKPNYTEISSSESAKLSLRCLAPTRCW